MVHLSPGGGPGRWPAVAAAGTAGRTDAGGETGRSGRGPAPARLADGAAVSRPPERFAVQRPCAVERVRGAELCVTISRSDAGFRPAEPAKSSRSPSNPDRAKGAPPRPWTNACTHRPARNAGFGAVRKAATVTPETLFLRREPRAAAATAAAAVRAAGRFRALRKPCLRPFLGCRDPSIVTTRRPQ